MFRIKAGGIVPIVAVLVALFVAAGYVLLDYGRLAHASTDASPDAASAATAGETLAMTDFQAVRQSLQSATADIAAERADINALKDQVSALTARIDTLQSAAQPSDLMRSPAISEQKKPPVSKRTGRVAAGGVPLPAIRLGAR